MTFYFSLYLQQVKGLAPNDAGIILKTQPLTQAILSPIARRLADRISPPRVTTCGMALCTAALLLCTTIKTDTAIEITILILLLLGMGFALFSSPNMTTIMGSIEPTSNSIASSLVATMRCGHAHCHDPDHLDLAVPPAQSASSMAVNLWPAF